MAVDLKVSFIRINEAKELTWTTEPSEKRVKILVLIFSDCNPEQTTKPV